MVQGLQDTYLGLEHRLLLLAWLNSLFGYRENRELLNDVRGAAEGYDASGNSYFFHHLTGRGAKLDAHLAQSLPQYDDNIRAHLNAINAGRAVPITLRYFQYLAVLYTEVILDRWMNHRAETLKALNRFAKAQAERDGRRDACPTFTESELQKLAFWMATGSGKTLILHFNYRQFLHYNGARVLDNILLITPNEGLSDQHMAEMAASGISSRRFAPDESGLTLGGRNVVQVIEITKLVEEKRGGGVTVGVECFQGNNLIFVDEGHKGAGGEVWRKYRDRLGETGFTFEYSATFGQALSAAGDDDLTQEYGKCIVFDYSYRYFHSDGYGKDFQVLNLQQTTSPAQTELLLLGGLLSFYEQHRYWRDHQTALQPYNLDAPLWVFVGSSVNAVYKEDGKPRSDVLTVARFLHHFLGNPQNRIVQGIDKILAGQTGITLGDDTDEDLFAGRFAYLKTKQSDARSLYQAILSDVFGTPAGAALHLCDIKAHAGELGLRAGNSERFFGVIYIGDTSTFKTLVEEDGDGIVLEDDIVSPSLFNAINAPSSPIQVLIGAKKFMEGWNSWRVSNMGLLNIGKREGSEIIQLFGRGVRLRGRKFSLQRSAATDGEHPPHIALLETLNIFALRANYMAQFRSYLEREGVPLEGSDVLQVKIKPDASFLKSQLLVPVPEKGLDFVTECLLTLQPDIAAKIRLDLSIKVTSIKSGGAEIATTVAVGGNETPIPPESLSCLDWQQLWLDLVQYKELKSWRNLHIGFDAPRRILEHSPRLYTLMAQEEEIRPAGFQNRDRLHKAALSILQRYTEKYVSVSRQRWESAHTVYVPLTKAHPNFRDVTVRVPRSEKELLKSVRKLLQEADKLYKSETGELPRLHFDRHLYQPLLIDRGGKISVQPVPLRESEQRFVVSLRDFVKQEAEGLLKGKELFLLRNLSRGCGIGFFENEGFYPDFILWIKEGRKQRVIFIEPHGMRHEKAYWDNEKVKLHEKLKDFTYTTKSGKAGVQLECVDSFIITETPLEVLQAHFADWSKEQLENSHILIAKEGQTDYLRTLFA